MLQPVWIAVAEPSVQAALAAELQQLGGLSPELLPADPQHLQQALAVRQGGLLLADLSLLPAILPVLQPGRFQLVGLTTLRCDPRAEKLAQWGAPTLHISQVAAFLAQRGFSSPPVNPHPGFAPSPVPALPTGPAAPPMPYPQADGGAQVVAVHSPKGGAGTSTVAAHLAARWASQGLRVLLVDFSPYGAAAILCKARQQGTGLEALASALEMAPHCLAEGFDPSPYLAALPVPAGCLDLLAGARPRLMDRFDPHHVSLLLHSCTQLPYDLVVVDTGSQPTPRTLAVLEAAHRLVLVATPDYTACWNLIQLQELLAALRLPAERLLVLNRFGGTGMSPSELQERMQLPVASILPEHPPIQELGNQGRPWELRSGDPFGEAVAHLAAMLLPDGVVNPVG